MRARMCACIFVCIRLRVDVKKFGAHRVAAARSAKERSSGILMDRGFITLSSSEERSEFTRNLNFTPSRKRERRLESPSRRGFGEGVKWTVSCRATRRFTPFGVIQRARKLCGAVLCIIIQYDASPEPPDSYNRAKKFLGLLLREELPPLPPPQRRTFLNA